MHIQITFERIGMRSYRAHKHELRMIWSKRRYIVSFVNEERRACSTLLPPKMMRVMRRNFLGMKKSSPSDLKMTKRAGLSGAFFLFWKQSSQMCLQWVWLCSSWCFTAAEGQKCCGLPHGHTHPPSCKGRFSICKCINFTQCLYEADITSAGPAFGLDKHNHFHAIVHLSMQINFFTFVTKLLFHLLEWRKVFCYTHKLLLSQFVG